MKRFGESENKEEYLQTKTVLDRIVISVSTNEISIDYSLLYEYILANKKKGKVLKSFMDYLQKSILGYGDWTCLSSEIIPKNEETSFRYMIKAKQLEKETVE